jgi:HEAT repeat protein
MVNEEELQRMKTSGDVNGLIRGLKAFKSSIRFESAETLGRLGDTAAIEQLIITLKDNDSNVRRVATEALGAIGDQQATLALISTLRDINKAVQRSACKALGNIGDPKAVEPLILILKDKDKHVRGQAIWALGALGDPAAIEALEGMKKDEDEFSDDLTIGEMAEEAIVRIKSSTKYINYLKDKMKKLDKEKRHAEALDVKRELGTWEATAKRLEQIDQQRESHKTEKISVTERKDLITDFMDRKPPEGPESPDAPEPFHNCPFCGKTFNLQKTPRFCPYCSEELN